MDHPYVTTIDLRQAPTAADEVRKALYDYARNMGKEVEEGRRWRTADQADGRDTAEAEAHIQTFAAYRARALRCAEEFEQAEAAMVAEVLRRWSADPVLADEIVEPLLSGELAYLP